MPSSRIDASLWIWNSFTPEIICNGAGKIALACTMLRVVVKRWHRWCLHTFIWQLVVLEITQIVVNYTQCRRVESIWNSAPQDERCWNPDSQELVSIVTGAYVDIIALVLALFPLVFITTLKVSGRAKLGLLVTVCVGTIAAACSILKVIADQNLSERSDFTWSVQDLVIWSTTENSATMIAATIPVLNPLVREAVRMAGDSVKQSKVIHSIKQSSDRRMSRQSRPAVNDRDQRKEVFSRGRSAPKTQHPVLPQPKLPPVAYQPQVSLKDLSSTRRSGPIEQPNPKIGKWEKGSLPPLPNTPRSIHFANGLRTRQDASHMSFLHPPSPMPSETDGNVRHPSAGYITREEQAYLGASAF